MLIALLYRIGHLLVNQIFKSTCQMVLTELRVELVPKLVEKIMIYSIYF